jgi:ABC-type bacteriocin/lantibiotic exporter with double-glycine peptidase domain
MEVDGYLEHWNRGVDEPVDEPQSEWLLLKARGTQAQKEAELRKQRTLDNIVCLKDINLKIKKGDFVCIIGKVGSGKSSLISALIGDLLPVPEQLLKSYMGIDGYSKELSQEEAEGF